MHTKAALLGKPRLAMSASYTAAADCRRPSLPDRTVLICSKAICSWCNPAGCVVGKRPTSSAAGFAIQSARGTHRIQEDIGCKTPCQRGGRRQPWCCLLDRPHKLHRPGKIPEGSTNGAAALDTNAAGPGGGLANKVSSTGQSCTLHG